MSKTLDLILKEAMMLSESERTRLVDELLTTFEPDTEVNVDKAWADEIEKRAADISNGSVTPVLWDEVKEKARNMAYWKHRTSDN
ncbi:MAG: addiction module protein [Nitrospirae bacterium]|nr:addiction module protein [Nitrospirota bacterium]